MPMGVRGVPGIGKPGATRITSEMGTRELLWLERSNHAITVDDDRGPASNRVMDFLSAECEAPFIPAPRQALRPLLSRRH